MTFTKASSLRKFVWVAFASLVAVSGAHAQALEVDYDRDSGDDVISIEEALDNAHFYEELSREGFSPEQLAQDYVITDAEARALAATAGDERFPVPVNAKIVRRLNVFLSTPAARQHFKGILAHMERYRTLLESTATRHQAPPQLMAIPIVETGYRNAPASRPGGPAGLWQFMPATARAYNLRVGGGVDERLNETKATDAAFRYLKAMHGRLNSWMLTILAYNAGEGTVSRGIRATGSHDAFHLIDRGYDGDPNYLPKVVAAIIIMKNCHILD